MFKSTCEYLCFLFEIPFERIATDLSSLATEVHLGWKEITPEIIKTSFKACALNLETGWSEDVLFHCF